MQAFKSEDMGVSQNWGYTFGGLYNMDYGILGSILGSPYLGCTTIWELPKAMVD